MVLETQFPIRREARDNVYSLVKDYFNRHFPLIEYKVLETAIGETDDIHGEIAEPFKRWKDPVFVRAYPIPTEVQQPLTQFLVEDKRVCDLAITVPHLTESGLGEQDPDTFEVVLKCGAGDLFTYHGRQYKVLTFLPSSRWANTDIIIYYMVHSELYRLPSDRYSI